MRLALKIAAILAAPFAVALWNNVLYRFSIWLGATEFNSSMVAPMATTCTLSLLFGLYVLERK